MTDAVKKPNLLDNFKALPSSTRTGIYGFLAVIVMFVVGTYMSDPTPSDQSQSRVDRQGLQIARGQSTLATEDLAAALSRTQKELEAQKQKLTLWEVAKKESDRTAGSDGHWTEVSNLVTQVQALQDKVNSMGGAPVRDTSQDTSTSSTLNKPLPLPGVQAELPPMPKPAAEIQVVGDIKAKTVSDRKQAPSAYLPLGSNFEAVLLNGMDASTSISANKTPTPALLRIKSDAILPNLVSFNIKECFVLVGGFGNMSSERVEMRTEGLSCISDTGVVYEGKLDGYVIGEDGKVGARGRIVSKQGALLAKSFMAGFVGGLGTAFAPQAVPALNIGGGTSQGYQYPSGSQVVGSGIANGLSKSSTALSDFYIRLAEQMFPIVELDAGRKMTIVLLKGVELKMEKKS